MWALRLRLTPTRPGAVTEVDTGDISVRLRTGLADVGVDHIRIIRANLALDGIVFVRGDTSLGAEEALAQAITKQIAREASLADFELTTCELDFFLSVEIGQPDANDEK
jgi:hypothetical protein